MLGSVSAVGGVVVACDVRRRHGTSKHTEGNWLIPSNLLDKTRDITPILAYVTVKGGTRPQSKQ